MDLAGFQVELPPSASFVSSPGFDRARLVAIENSQLHRISHSMVSQVLGGREKPWTGEGGGGGGGPTVFFASSLRNKPKAAF